MQPDVEEVFEDDRDESKETADHDDPHQDDDTETVDAEDVEREDDPDVAEVDLSASDLSGDGSDLFTGTDDADESAGSADASSDESDDETGEDEPLDALGERGEGMESAINEGAARLSVVGLEGEEADDLEKEFSEVFKSFRLGYFGSRVMEEYVFTDEDEEVDPAWGLFGSVLTCAALVVWLRPDSEEIVEQTREAVANISGRVSGD
jgi:hypothetical protein